MNNLYANSADDKLMIFFLFLSRKLALIFYEVSKPIFWGEKKDKKKKCFKMLSAEFFTQSAKP